MWWLCSYITAVTCYSDTVSYLLVCENVAGHSSRPVAEAAAVVLGLPIAIDGGV